TVRPGPRRWRRRRGRGWAGWPRWRGPRSTGATWASPPGWPCAGVPRAVARVGRLAEGAGAPVYVVHLSSAPGLAEVRAAQERGVALQAETCPQYLHLDATVLGGTGGENFVCTPPLRDPWHLEELWEGLARGWVQTVATDHCPFWTSDRRR